MYSYWFSSPLSHALTIHTHHTHALCIHTQTQTCCTCMHALVSFIPCSWLHHEATVCGARSSDRGEEQLEVEAILSDATVGKFKAKFSNSVMLTSVTRT